MAYDILGGGFDGPLMGDDILGDDALGEMMGDDVTGDDIMGAARQLARQRAGNMRGRQPAPVQLPMRRPSLYQARAGVSGPAVGRLPLGFGLLACTAASNTNGGVVTARPQVPWRGSKLIIGITGANNDAYPVLLRPTVGNRPVLAGAGQIDARAFNSLAVNNDLICDSGGPGVDVTLEFTIPGAGVAGADEVNIIAQWIGDAVV